jgi:hypothetical protein
MGCGRIELELELRDRVGGREIEGRGLVEVKLALGRPTSGGHAGRPVGQVEMEQDALHGGGEGNESEDLHLTAAGGAQEGEHLVNPSQELCPSRAQRNMVTTRMRTRPTTAFPLAT